MDNQNISLKHKVALLYMVAFLGLVMHVLMALFNTLIPVMQAILNSEDAGKYTETLTKTLAEFDNPAMGIMMLVFVLLFIISIVIPILFNSKKMKWVAFILGVLLSIMNIIDGITHIFVNGDMNGLYTLLISGGIGVIGVLCNYRWIKSDV